MEASVATAKAATNRSRAKRGDGPVVFRFVDAQGNQSNRINKRVAGVVVVGKDGSTYTANINSFAPEVGPMCAALAYKMRASSRIVAGLRRSDNKSKVSDLALEVAVEFDKGAIYPERAARAAKGTGRRGRPFDARPIADAIQEFAAERKRAGKSDDVVTDHQKALFQAMVESWSAKERPEKLAKYTSNKLIANLITKHTAKYALEKAKLDKAARSESLDAELDLGI